MSRIKGTYKLRYEDRTVDRWLDPATGNTWNQSVGGNQMATNFVQQGAVWVAGGCTWVPDAALAADWYVLRLVPDERRGLPPHLKDLPDFFTAYGPYTEEVARKNAALRSEKSAGQNGRYPPKAYAVVQVQAGNTVIVQPPAPPAPVTIWS